MINNKTVILYVAYGPTQVHKQVMLSILTLYYFLSGEKQLEKISLIVYTDNKEVFEKNLNGINIIYETLTSKNIKDYINDLGYIHRIKVCVIKLCIQKYRSNVLFIDSDTFFLKSPFDLVNKISGNTAIFHSKEFELLKGDENVGKKSWNFGYFPSDVLGSVIKRNNLKLKEGEIEICLNVEMWNSGVIGISYSNLPFLEDVLKLTDQISKRSGYFLAEQLAFSYVFLKKTTILKSDDFIYHYIYLKDIYNLNITNFLNENKDLTINYKAEKAVQLTKQRDKLLIPKKTETGIFTKKIKSWKKYNKTQIFFWIFHLRLQLIQKLKYRISNFKMRFEIR